MVQNSRPDVLCVKGLGPCKAIAKLAQGLGGSAACEAWAEEARISAIVGSCPRSLREVRALFSVDVVSCACVCCF